MEASERDENELRSQIIDQLEQSLAMSREMMMNQKLDPKTRENGPSCILTRPKY